MVWGVIGASRRRRLAGLVLAACAVPGAGAAGEGWTRARSAHFEVLSDGPPGSASELAARLEQFRRVLAAVLPASAMAPLADFPTVVVAFRDQRSFSPFLPLYKGRSQEVDGYFQAGAERDYIALLLDPSRPDPHVTAYHEYAHVVLNRTLNAQPLWLAEGLAEVLSRWEAAPGAALVGRPALEHVLRLQDAERRLPWGRVLRLDYASPLYNGGEGRPLFYAQAWALAHWALIGRGDAGPADLQAFLSAVAGGSDPERAFAAAFGADLPAVEARLPAYLARTLPVARYPAPGIEERAEVAPEAPAPAEVEYRLGDLLLHGGRLGEARRRLERAVEADPGFAPAHEALGHLALRQGKWEEARREIGLALLADPADAVALLRYAESIARETSARGEVLTEEREAEVVAALERALALDPHLADACEMLARLRPEPTALRLRQLGLALARDPGRVSLRLALASLYARRHDYAAARAALVGARTVARDEAHRFLSEHLLARLDHATAGTAQVKGRLLALDCRPDGVLRFVVDGAGARRRLRLDAPSASDVFLYGPEGEPLERTLTCGPVGVGVTAHYRLGVASPGDGPDGTLISLTFDPS